MNKFRITVNILAIAIFTLAFASFAQAQAPRTWVSGVGDDANPCSRTAPCKTFAGAISKTAAVGEISVLDPGGFGAVTITKSITLNGEGTLAGIQNSTFNGIIINAQATDNIILRNLSINATSNGLDGIRILAAKTVTIENCTIAGQSNGIDIAAGAAIHVILNNSQIKNCAGSGILSDTSAGTAKVTIKNSTISNCLIGIDAKRNSRLAMIDSTLATNGTGLIVEGTGGTSTAMLEHCQVSNNTGVAIQAGSASATNTSVVRISNNIINNNSGAAFSLQMNGSVETFVNNKVVGNNPDGCASCVNISADIN
jgi:hypothetical protein